MTRFKSPRSRRADLERRVAQLETDMNELQAMLNTAVVERPHALHITRCSCDYCGAHLLATQGLATLGGQCPNCGGQEFSLILARQDPFVGPALWPWWSRMGRRARIRRLLGALKSST